MEAYRRGASGILAAWAQKQYRGHRSIPESILVQLDECGLVESAPIAWDVAGREARDSWCRGWFGCSWAPVSHSHIYHVMLSSLLVVCLTWAEFGPETPVREITVTGHVLYSFWCVMGRAIVQYCFVFNLHDALRLSLSALSRIY
jgi:hypothetical protein